MFGQRTPFLGAAPTISESRCCATAGRTERKGYITGGGGRQHACSLTQQEIAHQPPYEALNRPEMGGVDQRQGVVLRSRRYEERYASHIYVGEPRCLGLSRVFVGEYPEVDAAHRHLGNLTRD